MKKKLTTQVRRGKWDLLALNISKTGFANHTCSIIDANSEKARAPLSGFPERAGGQTTARWNVMVTSSGKKAEKSTTLTTKKEKDDVGFESGLTSRLSKKKHTVGNRGEGGIGGGGEQYP